MATVDFSVEATDQPPISAVDFELLDISAPEDPTIVAERLAELDIEWTNTSEYDNVEVYRDTAPGIDLSDGNRIATLDGSAESYPDTGLVQGRTYYYRVAGVMDSSTVGSNETSGATLLDAPVIVDLDNSTAREITVTFDVVDDNDEGTVEIQRDSASVGEVARSQTEFTDDGDVLDGEQHEYVLVRDTGDRTAASSPETVIAYLPDAAGLSLDGTPPEDMVASWDDTLNNGQYRVQLRDDDPDGNHPDWGAAGEATINYDAVLEHTFSNVYDGEQYSVRVRTETDHSTGGGLTAEEINKMFNPTDVAFTNVQAVELTTIWVDNAEFRGSYQVYRTRLDRDREVDELVGTVGSSQESFVDDGVLPGAEYEYWVRARTDWIHADSNVSDPVTTDEQISGLDGRAVPPRGWHAEVDHPDATSPLTPQILDGAIRRPTINGYPRVELPAPHDETWHAEAFDDATLRVWHNADRQPIDTLQHRSLEEGSGSKRTVLEGRGGTHLERRVIEDLDAQPTHEFVEYLINQYTDYTANVDEPVSNVDEGVVLQDLQTSTDFSASMDEIPDDLPLTIVDDRLETQQVCWLFEPETFVTADVVSGSQYSREEASALSDLLQEGGTTFEVDHRIPAGDVEIQTRYHSETQGTNPEVEFRLDGETIDTLPKDSGASETIQWGNFTTSTPSSDLEPGTHEFDIQVVDTSDNTLDPIYIDLVSITDDRYNYNFDNSPDLGALDGPELYPDAIEVVFDTIASPISIVEAQAEVETNRGGGQTAGEGAIELGVLVDGVDTYDNAQDVYQHTAAMDGLQTESGVRAVIGRSDEARNGPTPRLGYKPQTLESVTLRGDLDDTPVLTNRSFDAQLIDVLQEVAKIGNFVFEVRADGDTMSVEWTQLRQRSAAANPDLADYSIDRQTEDIIERAIVYGGAQRVTRQTVDVQLDTWVDLPFPDSRLVEGKETVYNGDTEFEPGADYEIRYTTADGVPRIQALSSGSLSDGQTVSIDAEMKPRGELVQGDVVDETNARTVIEDIPGLASQQMCDQVALYLVEETGQAIVEASVTVPHDAVEWSVIDAIDPAQLPGDGPYQVREINSDASRTELQLGQGQTVGEAVQEIRDRTSRTEERV